mmetsp:Transcript_1331/g.3269  ORF Transcript_1331/g.3269 Transcript_1331/m.3269 type:complete len:626 (-) Transcript_1331:95-1972(-)
MLRADVGGLLSQSDELLQRDLSPHVKAVLHEQPNFRKVIQDELFLVPFQAVQRSISDGFLGHDDQFCHGLAVQTVQGIVRILEGVRVVLQRVPVVAETVHPAHNPHGPQVHLNFANVLLEFQVDDTVSVTARFGRMVRLQRRQLDAADQRAEGVAGQFQQCQQRRKVLDDEHGATKVRDLQQVTLVLSLGLAQCSRCLLDRSDADLFHSQASRQRLANFDKCRGRLFGLLHQGLRHLRSRHVIVFRQVALDDGLVDILLGLFTRIVQSCHGMEVGVHGIQLQLAEDLIVLALVTQQGADHAVEIPRILDDGTALGDALEGLLLELIGRVLGHLDGVVDSAGAGLFLLAGSDQLVRVVGEVQVLSLNLVQFSSAEIVLAPLSGFGHARVVSQPILVGKHEVDRLQPGNGSALLACHEVVLHPLRVRDDHTSAALVRTRSRRHDHNLRHQLLHVRLGVRLAHEREHLVGGVQAVHEDALRHSVVLVLLSHLLLALFLVLEVRLAFCHRVLLGQFVFTQVDDGLIRFAATEQAALLDGGDGRFGRHPHARPLRLRGLDGIVVGAEQGGGCLQLDGVAALALRRRPLVRRIHEGCLQDRTVRCVLVLRRRLSLWCFHRCCAVEVLLVFD